MSLEIALANAVSGLNAAQANLTLISGNVANAQTPGYSRETLPQTSQILDNNGIQYGYAAGNHDINGGLYDNVRGPSPYLDYFGPSRVSNQPSYCGATPSARARPIGQRRPLSARCPTGYWGNENARRTNPLANR